jgi:hypothetical protein
MKTLGLVCVFVVLAAAFAPPAHADTGVGVILGDPTGLSLLFGNRVAIGAAWDIDNYVHVHADVWLASRVLAEPVLWYAGVGGKLLLLYTGGGNPFDEEPEAAIGIGLRIPIGIQWYPIEELELFLEAAPGLFLVPATSVDVDLGLGIRYHF